MSTIEGCPLSGVPLYITRQTFGNMEHKNTLRGAWYTHLEFKFGICSIKHYTVVNLREGPGGPKILLASLTLSMAMNTQVTPIDPPG